MSSCDDGFAFAVRDAQDLRLFFVDSERFTMDNPADVNSVRNERISLVMTIAVHIPSALRKYCDGATELGLSASTVGSVLEKLKRSHPQIYVSVCDETGAVRPHVNLFVNESLLRYRDGLDTTLEPGDTLTIMPAVSGG